MRAKCFHPNWPSRTAKKKNQSMLQARRKQLIVRLMWRCQGTASRATKALSAKMESESMTRGPVNSFERRAGAT